MFHTPGNQDSDAAIRGTDADAAVARLSAAQKGYVQDPFIGHLVPRAHLQHPRPPLINIGTFVRSAAIDELVEQWLVLSGDRRCQIVSLGAGSDTRFWRIATGTHRDKLATYVEIDFPEVTSKKAMYIRKSKELSAVLGNAVDIHISHGGTALHAPTYHLLPADLRHSPSRTLDSLLGSGPTEAILSPSLPTLLLFECVLVYMSPVQSSAILEWFSRYFSQVDKAPLGSIVYEMFGLDDAFGRVMVSNLKTRNVFLPGTAPYPTVDSLLSRFLDTGFTSARALTLREIRQIYISVEEVDRVSRLEMLDEVEELDLVLGHYAVSWGTLLATAEWGDWGLKDGWG